MSRVDLRLTRSGPRQVRQSAGVRRDLAARAARIAARAGDGMETSAQLGATRARATVITATAAAKRAEATGRALTRAIDAGR